MCFFKVDADLSLTNRNNWNQFHLHTYFLLSLLDGFSLSHHTYRLHIRMLNLESLSLVRAVAPNFCYWNDTGFSQEPLNAVLYYGNIIQPRDVDIKNPLSIRIGISFGSRGAVNGLQKGLSRLGKGDDIPLSHDSHVFARRADTNEISLGRFLSE